MQPHVSRAQSRNGAEHQNPPLKPVHPGSIYPGPAVETNSSTLPLDSGFSKDMPTPPRQSFHDSSQQRRSSGPTSASMPSGPSGAGDPHSPRPSTGSRRFLWGKGGGVAPVAPGASRPSDGGASGSRSGSLAHYASLILAENPTATHRYRSAQCVEYSLDHPENLQVVYTNSFPKVKACINDVATANMDY